MTIDDRQPPIADRDSTYPGLRHAAIEKRRLAELRFHPHQHDVYDDCSAAENRALIDSIRRDGLRQPIEILPDGNRAGYPADTILDGHRRLQALRVLKVAHTEVRVRYDLLQADRSTVDAQFVRANRERRQLDMVQHVRAAIRQYEFQTQEGRRLSGRELEAAREQIGQLLGVSGRTVSRYSRLIRTPREVQRLVSHGLLPLIVGQRVDGLPVKNQTELVARLAGIDDRRQIRDIVAEYVQVGDGRHRHAATGLAVLSRALDAAVGDLTDRMRQVPRSVLDTLQPSLRRGRDLLDQLIALAAAPPRPLPTMPDTVSGQQDDDPIPGNKDTHA